MAVFLLVALSVLLAFYGQLPPRPKPADAPPTEFSAARALRHIEQIARVTHPANSFANDKVRDYILAALKDLGIAAQVQESVNADGMIGVYHNVLARIPGTANAKAFAMEAHYDSVPYGPGATDDCGGVGAMLETARAIKALPPLKNDVILVFSDSEEINAGGARAFAEHPWAKDVGVMLNFEARGTSGPSYMFETSDQNGWLIAEMVKAGVQPRATSVMFDVYKRSPFGSDFGSLKRKGIKGFNIAFVDHFGNYHTREDRPEVASLASLQHHGTYALGFARHFGNIPLDNVTAPDATYFNTFGSHLVYYPLSWGGSLAFIAAILLVLLIVLGLARGSLTVGGVLAGAGTFLLCAIALAVATAALTGLVYLAHGRYLVYNNNLYGVALAAVGIGIITALYNVFRRSIRVQNLAVGALLWWMAALIALQIYMPGGAYLALWPLIFGIAGTALLFLASPGAPYLPRGWVFATTLFALPAIFILLPSFVGFLAMGTILFSPVIAVFILLLFGLLMPQLRLLEAPNKAWLPALSTGVGLTLLIIGLLTNGASPSKPRFSCLSYGYDLDEGKAYWLSNDKLPDVWLRQFIPVNTPREAIAEFMLGHDGKYLKAPAPAAPVAGPQVQVLKDEVVDGKRNLTFHVGSAEAVTKMRLLAVTDSEVFASNVLGKDTGAANAHWHSSIELFPRGGVDVVLKLDPNQPLRIKAIEECYGLPEGLNIPPRPDYLVTEPNVTLDFGRPLRSEHTFITKTFTLNKPAVS